MTEQDHSQRTALFDIQEQYLLRSKPEITRVLRDLAKKPDIITAYFDGGSLFFLTAVIGVLPERDMVVLDYGTEDALNELALQAERLVCVTRHEHVSVRFTCTGLQRAKYQGRQVFAAPLPESVYRPQRREFFRVVTPTVTPLKVRVPRPGADPLLLTVVDLSCGGAALYDPEQSFEPAPGELIKGCGIELPGFGFVAFDLEIRSQVPVMRSAGTAQVRIGGQFRGLTIDGTALLQRYLHKLQLDSKR
ncbi:MAG: flagellar brake protein [Gammaproteobacteria bacterium]|nr:flagellar brake protein [Gammaproteobacteria bacterium]